MSAASYAGHLLRPAVLDATSSPETHAVIGALLKVYDTMGPGYLEAVYAECVAIEFVRRGIPHQAEAWLDLAYDGMLLKARYRADFVCFGRLIVELKAKASLGPAEDAQVLNYLKASGFQLGILVNFGAPSFKVRRYVNGLAESRPTAGGVSAHSADSAGVPES